MRQGQGIRVGVKEEGRGEDGREERRNRCGQLAAA